MPTYDAAGTSVLRQTASTARDPCARCWAVSQTSSGGPAWRLPRAGQAAVSSSSAPSPAPPKPVGPEAVWSGGGPCALCSISPSSSSSLENPEPPGSPRTRKGDLSPFPPKSPAQQGGCVSIPAQFPSSVPTQGPCFLVPCSPREPRWPSAGGRAGPVSSWTTGPLRQACWTQTPNI